jgi:hypothetical protein
MPGEYVLEDAQSVLQLPLNRIEERFKNDPEWDIDRDGIESEFSKSGKVDRIVWINYSDDVITYDLGSEVQEFEHGTYSLLEDHPESDFIEDELKAFLLPEWREKKYLEEQMPDYVKDSGVDTYEPISLDEIVDVLVPE